MAKLLRLMLMLLLLLLAQHATIGDSSKVCTGILASETTPRDALHKVRMLKDRLQGCQYVVGNVFIVRIDEQQFDEKRENLDLSFLNSIHEVTGCVHIEEYCSKRPLQMMNLTIIRGKGCSSSLVVTRSSSCAYADKPVLLPNLRYIGAGDVTTFGLQQCFLQHRISYSELFEHPAKQKYNPMLSEEYAGCSRVEEDTCDASCERWPDGLRHCWGPGKDHCQKRSKCRRKRGCTRCLISADGEEQCCERECLGGCYGDKASQCYGCKSFNKIGVCSDSCKPSLQYEPSIGMYVEEKLPKLYMSGPLCVKKCADSDFIQNDACVGKCSNGYSANKQRICVKSITSRVCIIDGKANTMICAHDNPLREGLFNSSLLCTEFHGAITIAKECFYEKFKINRDIMPLTTVQQLYRMLSKLRVVYGSITVDGPTPYSNLTFLASLERVEKSTKARSQDGELIINGNTIRFLGLSSLRHLAGNMTIHSRGKSDFCWDLFPEDRAFTDGLIDSPAFKLSHSSKAKRVSNFKKRNVTSTCRDNATCDPLCNSTYGCWGPGPKNCLLCNSAIAGDTCVASCNSEPGWYLASGSRPVASSVQNCSKCHSMCSNCSGPTSSNCSSCIAGVYRDGRQCIKQCLNTQYADDNRVCHACPNICLKLEDQPKCSGPHHRVGKGGCHVCTRLHIKKKPDGTQIIECLKANQHCDAGYYAGVLKLNSDPKYLNLPSQLAKAIKKGSHSFSVCRNCSQKCLTCEDSADSCTQCRYNRVDDGNGEVNCWDKPNACPPGYYANNGTCYKCHKRCSMCTSSNYTDCLKCNSEFYALNPNASGGGLVTCVPSCPSSHPKKRFQVGYGLSCFSSTIIVENEAGTTALIVGMVGFAVLIACLVVFYWLCQRGSKGKRDDAGEYDEDLQPLNYQELQLNRCSLMTISENELTRCHEVGSGAFGTVYKGEWQRGNEKKMSVAIKILSDSGDSSSMANELLEESRIMASVDHPHCVRLVGVCMTQTLQLITSFMPLGNLRDFLRARKDTNQIGSSHLLRYSAQIASGMHYLESKNIIHRDLACRNVLVSSAKCVKITDFGLAKLMDMPSAEYQASGGKLPVKWLALECLTSRRFSHKSDVWAYGVTLWEIFSFGDPPYTNVKPVDLADYLEKGERLKQPPICTLDVYMVMIKCWMLNENLRPTFEEMESNFKRMAAEPGRYVYIKGDRFARNLSHDSGSSSGRGSSCGSKSASLKNNNNNNNYDNNGHDQEGNYLSLDTGNELDNEVFEMEASNAAAAAAAAASTADAAVSSTLPMRKQNHHQLQQQPHQQPRHHSSSADTAGKQQQQQHPLRDNKYTLDPCHPIAELALSPAHPQPPPPLLPPPLRSRKQQQRNPSVESGDDYLQPIASGRRPSPSSTTSPTIHNPEYFFNSAAKRHRQPPVAPPPRTSSVATVKRTPSAASSSSSSAAPPVWLPSNNSSCASPLPPNTAASEQRNQSKIAFSRV